MAYAIDIQTLRTRASTAANAASSASAASPGLSQLAGADPYASFTAHHDALLVAGLSESQAFELAEAMCMRAEAGDDRQVCALECRHFRRGWCMDAAAAAVGQQLGELAYRLQRCAGFAAN